MATKEEELKGQKRNCWLQDSVVSLTYSLPILPMDLESFVAQRCFPRTKELWRCQKRSTALSLNLHFHSFSKSVCFSVWLDGRGVLLMENNSLVRACGWLTLQRVFRDWHLVWVYQLQSAESHMARWSIWDSFLPFQSNQHLCSIYAEVLYSGGYAGLKESRGAYSMLACTVACIIHMTEQWKHGKTTRT